MRKFLESAKNDESFKVTTFDIEDGVLVAERV
jgi:predicted O-methyltransferase YrrM